MWPFKSKISSTGYWDFMRGRKQLGSLMSFYYGDQTMCMFPYPSSIIYPQNKDEEDRYYRMTDELNRLLRLSTKKPNDKSKGEPMNKISQFNEELIESIINNLDSAISLAIEESGSIKLIKSLAYEAGRLSGLLDKLKFEAI